MTFLTRLIERHRADAPAPLPILEPRLPSRFEPVAFAAASHGVEWDAEAPRHAEMRIPAASRPAGVASQRQRSGERSEIPRVGTSRASLDAEQATVHASASRAMPDTRSSPPLLANDGPTAPPGRPSGPDRLASASAPSTRDGRPAAPPATSAPPHLRPPSPAPRTVRVERDPPAPRGGPTIHVTIGRVDVHAVMTPVAASPRPAASVETPSLEDYLRGRTRGGR